MPSFMTFSQGSMSPCMMYPPPLCWGFLSGSDSKESACNVRDPGLIPELERSLGEENGNPLQYSCLENPMDGEPGGLQCMGSQKAGTTE